MNLLNHLFPKRKEILELENKLEEERESLTQQLKDQQERLEQSIAVRHKQELDLIEGKSKLALKLAYYKKLLVQEKQRVTKEIENYQHELEEARKEAFQYSKQLMEVLEQREAKENKELQQDLLELNKKLETQEEITRQRQNFLEKNIKIDKVLYIEREKEEKKCIIYYDNQLIEEKPLLSLKDFLITFPEHLIFCNRSILVNKTKDASLTEKDKNKWVLLIGKVEIEITRANFKDIRGAFAPDKETTKYSYQEEKPMNLRNWKAPQKEEDYARNH